MENGPHSCKCRLQVRVVADRAFAEAAHVVTAKFNIVRVTGVPMELRSCLAEFDAALQTARAADRTTVIVSKVRASDWTEGGAFWQVGVPEVSDRVEVRTARAAMDAGLTAQRRGV